VSTEKNNQSAYSDLAIETQQLSRSFGSNCAVNNLDLQIKKSTIYGFLGPNGSGKTTAIRMLTGLLKPSTGTVNILGFELPKNAEKVRLNIGYMTQNFSLYDDLTVKENLQFLAKVYGLYGKAKQQRINELLAIYTLEKKANQLAGNMSGGQRQRLSLAAAVLHKPKLLFLDEPTSAVDPENRRDFWEKLFDLCDQGTTICVSTHYMDEAERCHQLAILESGIKCADGSPEELMSNMNAHVVEVTSKNLRSLKQQLLVVPEVISTAQLGIHLRVLISKKVTDPIRFLKELHINHIFDKLTIVRPSLEDVFVIATKGNR